MMMLAFARTLIAISILNSSSSNATGSDENWRKTNLRAIIRSDVFQRFAWKKAPEYITEPDDPEHKSKLCRNIFTTSFFKTHLQEDWFDVDAPENRDKLKKYSDHILNEMPDDERSIVNNWLRYYLVEDAPKNRYHFREIEMNQSNEGDEGGKGDYEQVFHCLVEKRPRRSEDISEFGEYFVSEMLRVTFPDFKITDIVGRFVYSGTKKLKLIAFAADVMELCRNERGVDAESSRCSEFELDVKDEADLKEFAHQHLLQRGGA